MDANPTGRRTEEALDCRRVRERLCEAGPAGLSSHLAGHLAECPACAAFARRLQLARQALGRPLSALEPDPLFQARVVARIERPAELIGWAAFRALPAAVGLALALAGIGWLAPGTPPQAAPPDSPDSQVSLQVDEPPSSDQLLAWSSLSPEIWP
jgi:anti-sigma factor RsiW